MEQTSSTVKGWIIGIVAIAVMYGVLNLVLVGGQKIWHHGDQVKLDALKKELDSEIVIIQDLERKVKNNTISDRQYKEYSLKIEDYNNKVKEVNALAEKIGGTFYVIPIPGKGH